MAQSIEVCPFNDDQMRALAAMHRDAPKTQGKREREDIGDIEQGHKAQRSAPVQDTAAFLARPNWKLLLLTPRKLVLGGLMEVVIMQDQTRTP